MKRLLPISLLSCLCLLSLNLSAASGFFTAPDATFIVYDVDGGGNTFTDSENTLSGSPMDLGTVSSLILNGGEAKTFKNGADDITEVRIMYRIYPTGAVSGSFSPVILNFLEDCDTGAGNFPSGGGCGAGGQKWQTPGNGSPSNINILTGLNPETGYTLEFYFEADFNTGGATMTHFRSNGGTNYALTFTTPAAPPEVPTLSEWGLIILALSFMTLGTLHLTQQRREQA